MIKKPTDVNTKPNFARCLGYLGDHPSEQSEWAMSVMKTLTANLLA